MVCVTAENNKKGVWKLFSTRSLHSSGKHMLSEKHINVGLTMRRLLIFLSNQLQFSPCQPLTIRCLRYFDCGLVLRQIQSRLLSTYEKAFSIYSQMRRLTFILAGYLNGSCLSNRLSIKSLQEFSKTLVKYCKKKKKEKSNSF